MRCSAATSGVALKAGIAIVLLAIILDRVTRRGASGTADATPRGSVVFGRAIPDGRSSCSRSRHRRGARRPRGASPAGVPRTRGSTSWRPRTRGRVVPDEPQGLTCAISDFLILYLLDPLEPPPRGAVVDRGGGLRRARVAGRDVAARAFRLRCFIGIGLLGTWDFSMVTLSRCWLRWRSRSCSRSRSGSSPRRATRSRGSPADPRCDADDAGVRLPGPGGRAVRPGGSRASSRRSSTRCRSGSVSRTSGSGRCRRSSRRAWPSGRPRGSSWARSSFPWRSRRSCSA